jgi:transposase
VAQGTITEGLRRSAGLFEPMMPALHKRQMGEKLFQGDETRWEVFEKVEGKTGHRWELWVMQSASVVFYRMAPGRGADVPIAHFPGLQRDLLDVVLVCDRSSAYKCLVKGSDIHVMLALRCSSRQVIVADEQLDGPDMVGELLGKGQRVAHQP